MEAYLDHSATTRCSRRVQEIMFKTMDAAYGNPSSMHKKGLEAERYVKEAAEKIAKTLKVSEKEIIFTSGGTESNNLALIGAAMANRRAGNRLITTQIEHPSVRRTMEYLAQQGFEVITLPVSQDGILILDALQEALNDQTILVSVMQVNNEIGSVQPIEKAAKLVHDKRPDILFHADAVQSYGKMQIRPKKSGIDLLSVSGHKIQGPKGIGFLYKKEKVKLAPLLHGGGQQYGIRSGTYPVPGIAGIGEAAAQAYENLSEKTKHLHHLKNRLLDQTADLEAVGKKAPRISSIFHFRASAVKYCCTRWKNTRSMYPQAPPAHPAIRNHRKHCRPSIWTQRWRNRRCGLAFAVKRRRSRSIMRLRN